MTPQEAIKIIKDETNCLYMQLNGMCGDFEDCVKTKLDFPYYKVELAFETAIEALKKQIPKKPTESDLKIRYCEVFKCPTCGFEFSGRVAKYCYRCGQALDWSDTND